MRWLDMSVTNSYALLHKSQHACEQSSVQFSEGEGEMPTFKSSPLPMTRKIHCWFGAQNTLGWFTFSPPQQEDLHSALKYLPRKISFPWKTLSGSLQCCRSTCMYLCVTCIVHIVLSIHSSEEELASCELTQGQVNAVDFPYLATRSPFV